MGSSGENIETPLLLPLHLPDNKIPKDSFNLIYITYFILGVSCLLPWNTFITAIDYFSHIYPHTHINRIFSVVYMPVVVSALLSVVFFGRRCDVRIRINLGLGLYVFSLLLMPLLEVFYIRGRVGLFNGFYVSIGAVVLCAVGQALVQSGVVGSAGELPKRYMQAAVSGFAGSGYVTEDVSSKILKDWYPITLITAYYVLDLIGKSLASIYVMKSPKITMGLCIGRVVFYPLFVGCLHGPKFLRTEIPVIILTCFLGLTNGYLTAVAMISAPKLVSFEHAEVAGILMAMSLVLGVAIGSVLAWFWVI
ncbi:equilibrative nucleotide transporter 1 [Cucumis melo var. makuwa]|uniref:Equilibrative nucleotide transporter 1 n=1 Tax=Cucumis melo var. makuwa TaxID=1194695 RepID=A0A5D3CWH4_CUCMM|nr:equilibrative nucleotide transporter 1 [Cucumis melo var. makuwa]